MTLPSVGNQFYLNLLFQIFQFGLIYGVPPYAAHSPFQCVKHIAARVQAGCLQSLICIYTSCRYKLAGGINSHAYELLLEGFTYIGQGSQVILIHNTASVLYSCVSIYFTIQIYIFPLLTKKVSLSSP